MYALKSFGCLLAALLLQACSGTPPAPVDAGRVDAGGHQGLFPDGGSWWACEADAGDCACTADSDCAISHLAFDVQRKEDCFCESACGGVVVNWAAVEQDQADYQRHCAAWSMPEGFPDGGGCVAFDGLCSHQQAICIEARCTGTY